MNVDTGEFRALTGRLADMSELMLTVMEATLDRMPAREDQPAAGPGQRRQGGRHAADRRGLRLIQGGAR
jgi:hypothetical protein